MKFSRIAAFGILATLATPAKAVIVNYEIAGAATGTFNGTPFTGQSYTVNFTGDPSLEANLAVFSAWI